LGREDVVSKTPQGQNHIVVNILVGVEPRHGS
jgi:hypothetical protein